MPRAEAEAARNPGRLKIKIATNVVLTNFFVANVL